MNHPLMRSATLALWIGLAWLSGTIAPHAAWAQEPATESPGPTAAEGWQVRIVWFVEGLADDAARVPPPDLDAPLEALSSLGITNLTMAAQLIVPAVDNEDFLVSGSAKVSEPCAVEVTGLPLGRVCTGAGDQATQAVRLQIAMVATAAEADVPRTLCELRTTLLAPLGRPVVLAVTPVHARPSVMLLLVTPRTPVAVPPVAERPSE